MTEIKQSVVKLNNEKLSQTDKKKVEKKKLNSTYCDA